MLVPPSYRLGHEERANVATFRSFKLPRKVAGSNGGEGQVLSFSYAHDFGQSRNTGPWFLVHDLDGEVNALL